MARRIALSIALLMAFGTFAMAQGTSPVKIVSVSVSPTSFKAGDAVTVTVQIENTAATPYGCVGAGFFKVAAYVFKAAPHTVTNQVWSAEQALTTPLAAHERRTVALTTKWTVPNIDTPSFQVVAWSPVCAPDEFGQNAVITIGKSCVYSYSPALTLIRMPLRERLPMMIKR
jgi:hypothetical protein